MIIIKEYLTAVGQAPVTKWRRKLDGTLKAKVFVALEKLERGVTADIKDLQAGLFEIKLPAGGGIRIYFMKEGYDVILLLGGGHKDSQKRDIESARARLADYLARKERENGR